MVSLSNALHSYSATSQGPLLLQANPKMLPTIMAPSTAGESNCRSPRCNHPLSLLCPSYLRRLQCLLPSPPLPSPSLLSPSRTPHFLSHRRFLRPPLPLSWIQSSRSCPLPRPAPEEPPHSLSCRGILRRVRSF